MVDVSNNIIERVEAVSALHRFPYFILNNEDNTTEYREDLIRIKENYLMYKRGVKFYPEGSGGDYVPSQIRYKNIKNLINKEARFMFSQTPDINIMEENKADERVAESYRKLVDKVLTRSKFQRKIVQAAKDCFIGKRIAILVDWSEDVGAMLHFYTALQFYYTYEDGTDVINKFVCFERLKKRLNTVDFLIYTYTLENGKVYVEGGVYDSMGVVREQLIARTDTGLEEIPAVIVFNDGTLEDYGGISEIEDLEDFERGYNKLANGDIDSVGKGMNPIRYTIDMNSRTTKNLSSSAGSYWDLKSEQNQDNVHPAVGILAPSLNHTEALKATLDRLKQAMHEALEVPDINAESLAGTITSGKALEALYYPLTVRCDEKLKSWKPALESMVRKVIELALIYESEARELYVLSDFREIQYDVDIQENYALLSNAAEEMELDLQEIAQNARSRKSYINKWRKEEVIDDDKVEEELMQIAVEQNMFDTTSINMSVQENIDDKTADVKSDSDVELLDAESDLKSKKKVGDIGDEGEEGANGSSKNSQADTP